MAGDDIGSDELSSEEFDSAEQEYNTVMDELRKVVDISEAAKSFLGTPFGQTLRKTILSEKMKAMKKCSENFEPSMLITHKYQYDVICGVEKIFSYIISDGDAALRELTINTGDEDDYEN